VKIGSKRGVRFVAVAAAALLVAGGAVAVAEAAHGGNSKGKAKGHAVKRSERLGVHADVSLVRADGTTDAFAVDRGRVTAASSSSVTLVRLDGKSVTLGLSSSTVVRGTIAVGRPVFAFSRNGTAFRIGAPGPFAALPTVPPSVAKSPITHLQVDFVRADASTGTVTLDRGQVTASSSSSLTIKRADGKSVTFTIATGAVVRGSLAAGSKVLVYSRNGRAFRVFGHAGATAAG